MISKIFDRHTSGFALLAAMLLAMSLLMMVTVMLKTSQTEFQAARLNGRQLASRYIAKAACAEMVVRMGTSNDWGYHLNGEPMEFDEYELPVTVTFQTDPAHNHLIQVRAECQEQTALRVVRNSAQSEALLFTSAQIGGTRRFYRTARREGRTSGGGDSSWRPISAPPSVVFDGGGQLVPFNGDSSAHYAADFKGHFYTALSGPEGFAVYSYAGSGGWERLPGRPAVEFTTAGATSLSSGHTGVADQPVMFDASKDGKALWFVENVQPQAGMAEGAAYLQKFDFETRSWSAQALPKDYTLSSDGHYRVQDISVGSDGKAYLLTSPTDSQPSRVLQLDGTTERLLPGPPRQYYGQDGDLITAGGQLDVESIAVDAENNLFISAPTGEPDWYTVSRYSESGGDWELGLDTTEEMSPLGQRDFSSEPGFRPLTVDSSDYVVVGDKEQAVEGYVQIGFSEVDELPEGVSSDRSKIGGGLGASPTTGFRTTAEY